MHAQRDEMQETVIFGPFIAHPATLADRLGSGGAGDHDTPAIADFDASLALGETFWQRSVARHGEPESQHVPAAFRFRPVDETRTIVEQAVVVNELHVS